MKRWVSQGAVSPTSTCLFWSLGGTGSTPQEVSALMCAVLSRKFGRSPDRSSWTFLDALSCRIWWAGSGECQGRLLSPCAETGCISYLIHILIEGGDQLTQKIEAVSGEELCILCMQSWRSGWQLHADCGTNPKCLQSDRDRSPIHHDSQCGRRGKAKNQSTHT